MPELQPFPKYSYPITFLPSGRVCRPCVPYPFIYGVLTLWLFCASFILSVVCFPLTLLFAFLGLLAEKGHMAKWGFFRSLPLPLLSLSALITPISGPVPLLIVSVSCWTGRLRKGEPLCVFPVHHLSGGLVGGHQPLWSEWHSEMGQGGDKLKFQKLGQWLV